MSRLHLRHPNIAAPVLEAINEMHSARPWEKSRPERAEIVKVFATAMADMAPEEIAVPEIVFERTRSRGYSAIGYRYTPAITGSLGLSVTPAKITFPRWRTVEVITAVRKHILFVTEQDRDGDPLAWACSALYQANPAAFRFAARKNKVRSVDPKDTYTTESWNKIVAAGLADRRGHLRFQPKDITYFLRNGEMPPPPSVDEGLRAVARAAGEVLSQEELAAEVAGPDVDLEPVVVPDEDTADLPEEEPNEQDGLLAGGELAEEATVVASSEVGDGLDGLGIVQLRKVSRGFVSGGYSMTKPILIHAIRTNATAEQIAARVAEVA